MVPSSDFLFFYSAVVRKCQEHFGDLMVFEEDKRISKKRGGDLGG
jgi:hypothetical protein